MLIQRRSFLTGVAAGTALMGSSSTFASDGLFHWYHPGFAPYDKPGRRLNEALHDFRDLFAQDPDVADEFRENVKGGRYISGNVFAGWQVTRMKFAPNESVSNVIVDAKDFVHWSSVSTKLRMYTAERVTGTEKRFYTLFFPEVCGNWCIKLGRVVCLLDTKLCDQGCQQRHEDLKRRQRVFR